MRVVIQDWESRKKVRETAWGVRHDCCSRASEQPFKVGECVVFPIYLLDFEFSKALKYGTIL